MRIRVRGRVRVGIRVRVWVLPLSGCPYTHIAVPLYAFTYKRGYT